tara:strand:+ start:942 stop:1808 length:867 start_codon:yes stop_codon:yes gene_type:complete
MNKSIANWDTLSDEEKKRAAELLKGQPALNPATAHPAAKFFEENGWVKIEKYIDTNMANLLYHHIQLEAQRLAYLEDNSLQVDETMWGTFTDKQAPGDFSKYGDPIFDALLSLGTEKMCELTGKDLVPTYSYHRLYTQGTELKRHKDRPSCEISTTLCIGYDNSNVDASKYPDWDWPMFVGPKTGEIGTEGMPIHMKPGDMLIYRGDVVEHWREPLWGNNHAQVFLHYNEKEGQYDIPYDGRPLLGMPSTFRSKEALNKNEDIAVSKQDNDSESKGLFMPEYKDKVVY